KASGRQGVPHGGGISPLLSNVYLTEVDAMLERANAVTRHQQWTSVEYARFADDLVGVVNAHPRQRWLRTAGEQPTRGGVGKPASRRERGEESARRPRAGRALRIPGL